MITSTPAARLPAPADPVEVALRCAWLREHGRRLFDVDPTGQLSAQLWDFADLLEIAEREGWWSR